MFRLYVRDLCQWINSGELGFIETILEATMDRVRTGEPVSSEVILNGMQEFSTRTMPSCIGGQFTAASVCSEPLKEAPSCDVADM
jgi:hypothetical protein